MNNTGYINWRLTAIYAGIAAMVHDRNIEKLTETLLRAHFIYKVRMHLIIAPDYQVKESLHSKKLQHDKPLCNGEPLQKHWNI